MPGVIQVKGSLKTETRLGTQIENNFDRGPLMAGKLIECASYRTRYPAADHTRGVASASYNCHGLTFASRRTGIADAGVVRAILQEDDYIKVDRSNLKVGDTVIYIDADGDITHSGIVVEVPDFGAKVLSKWGECHEVIHAMGDCPYNDTTKEFYRVCK